MRKKRSLWAISMVLLLIIAAPNATLANDEPNPPPFSIISQDTTVVFHFNPQNDLSLPITGLHHNTYPYESIFLVERPGFWHGYEENFFFSVAMRHFAFVPPYRNENAIEFYAHGALISSYTIYDLVENRVNLANLQNPMDWLVSTEYSPVQNTITITTFEGLSLTFDISSGRILHALENPPATLILIFVAAGIMLAIFAMNQILRRRNNSNSGRQSYYDR